MNQSQVDHILELENQMKAAESAFMAALNEAGYKIVWTGSYENTRRYMVHPDYADEAEKHSKFLGIEQDWLDTLPPGIVFEP